MSRSGRVDAAVDATGRPGRQGTRRMTAKILLIIGMALPGLLMAIRSPLRADDSSAGLNPETLNVGFTRRAFLGVNPMDAEAAFKTLARTLGAAKGYDIDITVRTFESARHLSRALTAETVNLIILDSWSYLEMTGDGLEPVFVPSDQGRVTRRYLLLARSGGNLKTLLDLRGRSLNLLAAPNANLGVHWLRVLLSDRKLGMAEAFFGVLEDHTDPMAAVLPVFFGKRDAVLVDATKFELMTELNPQLNSLEAIDASEPLVNAVICLGRSGWSSERFRQDLVQAMAELHLKPAGQQILTLFKAGRMVPFVNSHLDTVRRLRARSAPRQHEIKGAPGSPVAVP